jgi:hypothetical protein
VSRSGSIVFMKKAENTSNDASQPASKIHMAFSFRSRSVRLPTSRKEQLGARNRRLQLHIV